MVRKLAIETIAFLFILLFMYAAINKIIHFEKFTIQIGQSPLLTGFGNSIPWLVITAEIVTSILIAVPALRLQAFLFAFSLMVMFTLYIITILNFSPYVPCSCGGVLERLGWSEHLIFNSMFVVLSLVAIALQARENEMNRFMKQGINHRTPLRKRILLATVSCFLASCGIVGSLLFLSDHIRQRPGSFLRQFRPHPIVELESKNVGYNSYYIAGGTKHTVYLGNY